MSLYNVGLECGNVGAAAICIGSSVFSIGYLLGIENTNRLLNPHPTHPRCQQHVLLGISSLAVGHLGRGQRTKIIHSIL